MMTVLIVLIVAVLVIAGLGGAFAFALMNSSKKTLAANAAIPGVDVVVPESWGGSHDPEARLHRRIRDAVRALDATIASTTAAQIDDRARLLVSAHELDERLVAIWSLPAAAKPAALAEVEQGVAALEAAAAQTALSASDGAVGRVPSGGSSGVEIPPLPQVPDVTPPQPAEREDRREPPSSLAQ